MHELSIALNIINLVEDAIKEKEPVKVVEVELEIGKLAGIDTRSLVTALETASIHTPLSQARYRIKILPAIAKCKTCGLKFNLKNYLSSCPACKSYETEIINGKELKLKTIKINN